MLNPDYNEDIHFFKSILGTMNAAVYITNLQPFRVEWISDNRQLRDSLGLTAEGVVANGEAVARMMLEQMSYQQSVDEAVQYIKHNPNAKWTGIMNFTNFSTGEKRWGMYSTAPYEVREGKVYKALTIAIDVTDQMDTDKVVNLLVKSKLRVQYQHLYDHLTKRQLEIIRHIAQGLTTKEVAAKLKVSPNTIENHRANIYSRMNVKNATEMVALAEKAGLLIP